MGAQARRRTTALAAVVTALGTAATLATTVPADATGGGDPSGRVRILDDTVAAPFQVAVRGRQVYYTDGIAGTVNRVRPGADQVVARVQGEIAGVEFRPGHRTMAFTSSTEAGTRLTIRHPGRPDVVADLSGYEQRVNPDGRQRYGVVGSASTCAREWLQANAGHGDSYTGEVDSHPYQVAYLGRGAWAVADAGGNDVLRVGPRGGISTLAVLPPQPVTVTRSIQQALGAPDCVRGVTFAFEPVPTDVERGPRGGLWVSTLPGGPEDASLGARGSVYRLSARGVPRRYASGFLGATNLAVAPGGDVYVAELFGGKVTRLHHGRRSTAVRLARPVAVEARGHRLYVGQLGVLQFGPPPDPSSPPGPPTVTEPGSVRVYHRR